MVMTPAQYTRYLMAQEPIAVSSQEPFAAMTPAQYVQFHTKFPPQVAKELAFTMMLAEGGDPLAQDIMSRQPAAIQRLAFKMREESEKRLMKLEEQEQRAYLHAELGIKPQES